MGVELPESATAGHPSAETTTYAAQSTTSGSAQTPHVSQIAEARGDPALDAEPRQEEEKQQPFVEREFVARRVLRKSPQHDEGGGTMNVRAGLDDDLYCMPTETFHFYEPATSSCVVWDAWFCRLAQYVGRMVRGGGGGGGGLARIKKYTLYIPL